MVLAEGHLEETGELYSAEGDLLAESRSWRCSFHCARGSTPLDRLRGARMELCLMIEGQEGVSWDQWLALAETCERSGIPALFRSDHYMNLDGAFPERAALDAWGTLCALAARTTTLRLGTMVSPTSLPPPVGAGQARDHCRPRLRRPGGTRTRRRMARGRARGLRLPVPTRSVSGWTSSPSSSRSSPGPGRRRRSASRATIYRLEGLRAEPRPVQHPHPPLIIGGTAGPRSAALAARFADEYNTVFPTVEDVRERRAKLAEACRAAGRDELPLSIMTAVVVGRDDAELRDRVAARARRMNTDADALLADPPSGWIVGTIESAADQLGALPAAGVTRVMCQHFDHADLEMVRLLGEQLSPLVLTR